MKYYDSLRDPVDNAIIDSYYWQTTSSTGGSTTYFETLRIPDDPNFPASTSIRYLINLPGEPYYDAIVAGSATFVVKNINTSSVLTRVAYNGTLTANTYKIFPSNSAMPAKLEVHVGAGSNSGGDELAMHGRFINNILCSSQVNIEYMTTSQDVSQVKIYEKIIEIGIWDVSGTSQVQVDANIDTQFSRRIIGISGSIRDDNNENSYFFNGASFYNDADLYAGSIYTGVTTKYINIFRSSDGFFAGNAAFNDTSINRGYVSIKYFKEY